MDFTWEQLLWDLWGYAVLALAIGIPAGVVWDAYRTPRRPDR